MEVDTFIEVSEINKEKEKQNEFEKSYTYDEAIHLTGDGIYQFKIFVIFGMSILSLLIETTNMAYALPLAQCDLNLTISEQGAISSIGFFAAVITTYFWGFLSDTWGRKKVLMVSYVIVFVFSCSSSLCSSSTSMLVARFFAGVGVASIQPSITAYLSEFHCNQNRAKWLSKINVFIASAFVVQPMLSLMFVTLGEISLFNGLFVMKPWRLFVLTTSLIPMLCFLLMLNLPESPKFLFIQGKYRKTLEILNKIHHINYKRSNKHKEYPVKHILRTLNDGAQSEYTSNSKNMFIQYMRFLWSQTKPLFFQPHLFNLSMLCFITFVLYMGVFGLYIWFPYIVSIYQQNINSSLTVCEALDLRYVLTWENSSAVINTPNFTNVTMTTPLPSNMVTPIIEVGKSVCVTPINSFTFQVTTVLTAMLLCFHLFIAMIIHKLGPKYVLSGGLLVTSGLIVSVLFTHNFYLNVFLIKFSSIVATFCTVLYTISSDLFPTQNKTMAISFIGLIGRIGSAFGGSFVGPLLLNYCSLTMTVFAALVIVCTVISFNMLIRLEKFNKKESARESDNM